MERLSVAPADGCGRRSLELSAPVRKILAFLRRMGFNYSCFRIFALSLHPSAAAADTLPAGYRFAELSSTDLSICPISELQACEGYGGQGAYLFGIFGDNGVLACVQCIWFGERYQQRAFWPLGGDEAASINLVTAPLERHKGLATHLKKHSAERMRQLGFSRLYSRIWWTNTASLRVSEKAGWSHVGTILEVVMPRISKPVRIVFGKHARPSAAVKSR
jgi:GNAT superfamily N-acetyltransferase